jgi:hypothetical protein
MPSVAFLLLIVLAPVPQQSRTGRLRPPEAVTCDRNKLTAFSGVVTAWSRNDSAASLRMSTDADTRESFTIRFEKGTPQEKWFLRAGEVFRPEDWAKIEKSPGVIRPGIQATVWVCEGGVNPIVDWRLPPK